MADFIKINPVDNVVIALKDFSAGDKLVVDGQELEIKNDIPKGHKIALTAIAENEDIIKYGAPIGHATQAIEAGEHIHVQNLKTNLSGTINYSFDQKLNELSIAERELTFQGYKRSNGKVGIRNELWIVPTVGCVNGQAQQIIEVENTLADESKSGPALSFMDAGCREVERELGAGEFDLNQVMMLILETLFRGLKLQRIIFCLNNPRKRMMMARLGLGLRVKRIIPNFMFPLKKRRDLFSGAMANGTDIFVPDSSDPAILRFIPRWYKMVVDAESFFIYPVTMNRFPVALIYGDAAKSDVTFDEKARHQIQFLRDRTAEAIERMMVAV